MAADLSHIPEQSHLVNFSSLTITCWQVLFRYCVQWVFLVVQWDPCMRWFGACKYLWASFLVAACFGSGDRVQGSFSQVCLVFRFILHFILGRGSRCEWEGFCKALGLRLYFWHGEAFVSYTSYLGLQPLKWEACIEDLLEEWGEQHRHNSGAYRISIKWVFMTLMHCAWKDRAQNLYHWVYLQHMWQCHAIDIIWIFLFLRYTSIPLPWLMKSLVLSSFISLVPSRHMGDKKIIKLSCICCRLCFPN